MVYTPVETSDKYTMNFTVGLLLVLTNLVGAQDICYCFSEPSTAPDLIDCVSLLNDFGKSDDRRIRLFDEEQMRADESGNWPGLADRVGAAQLQFVVPLPRMFSRSMLSHPLERCLIRRRIMQLPGD